MKSRLQIAVEAELARRKSGGNVKLNIVLDGPQKVFVEDKSRFIVARCGRRSGKSVGAAVRLINKCMSTPNAHTLYLAMTRDQAVEIMATPLIKLLDEAKIPYQYQKSNLKFMFRNGSFIRLFGADSEKAKNRLLGQSFHEVVIDECGYTSDVDTLATRVLLPALQDYSGTIVLTSTPPSVFQGLFYEADQGNLAKYWSHHSWTLKENVFFKARAETIFQEVIETEFGGNANHPTFLREYKGQWVAESSDQIYPVTAKNIVDKVPSDNSISRYYMGLDLGLNDDNAITILRVDDYSRDVYVVDSWAQNGMTVDQLAGKINSYLERYKIPVIIADTGGYGAGIVNELRSRYQMPITAADKKDKSFYQEILKADIISGYIKILKGLEIIPEMQQLVRDPKTGEADKKCKDHRSDSLLYVYRYAYTRHLKHQSASMTQEDLMISQLTQKLTVKEEEKVFGEDF